MPRLFTFLAILAPIVAVFLVFRTLDVSARLAFSWPLASHPDTPGDAGQLILSPDTEDISSPQPHPIDGSAGTTNAASKAEVDALRGQFRRKIVAVGDLHGDLPNALQVLQMAHVVDRHGHWSGNVDVFVQTGDIIDRCVPHDFGLG